MCPKLASWIVPSYLHAVLQAIVSEPDSPNCQTAAKYWYQYHIPSYLHAVIQAMVVPRRHVRLLLSTGTSTTYLVTYTLSYIPWLYLEDMSDCCLVLVPVPHTVGVESLYPAKSLYRFSTAAVFVPLYY